MLATEVADCKEHATEQKLHFAGKKQNAAAQMLLDRKGPAQILRSGRAKTARAAKGTKIPLRALRGLRATFCLKGTLAAGQSFKLFSAASYSGTFDGSGNFAVTNAVGGNRQQFYILQVP